MDNQLILAALVVPAFFIFIALEYWAAQRKKMTGIFKYENTVANISVGIAERLLNLLITGSFYGLYYFVYEHYALYSVPNAWWVWGLLLLTTDLVWYWYHRLGHEINLMWGAHIVHHQSEDFNYSASARITTIQSLIRNLFWCTLPLLGFHPAMVITILVVHGTYSFFTHTQVIGKLGWLEYFLVTPSHHRVHHASNEKYINKNYGDIFIFWDKLFGTFQKEEEKPVYGLTHPLKSYSFLWQHFHYYIELWEACRRSKSFSKSIKIILGKPEDLDQGIREDLERKFLSPSRKFKLSFRFKVYLNIQLIASLVILFLFTLYFEQLDVTDKTIIISIILITLINCGAMLEQQRWIYMLEVARVSLLTLYVSMLNESIGMFITFLIIILLIGSNEVSSRLYFRFVYGRQTENENT
ncbi:MAG: sterol desaturase family protein [Cyclobacteriaceae bacterium]|nr:sterol desaturase family protein [Cyclobacteriaceae bacterium]